MEELDKEKQRTESPTDLSDEEKPTVSTASKKRTGTCYCGKDRNINIVELLCAHCTGWFHESCISYQLGRLVPFITNYVFICKNCSPSGLESYRKSQATFSQMCVTALANLQHDAAKEGNPKTKFSKDLEIIPYIEHYWEAITTMPRRVTNSWHTTVQRTLLKDVDVIFTHEEGEDGDGFFGLHDTDLKVIKPNYEAPGKLAALRLAEDGSVLSTAPTTSKGKKRRFGGEGGQTGKKGRPSADLAANVKLPPHGYPLDHPFNKDGYRYMLAEPDPHAPYRREFDESPDWAGKPIPGWLYRTSVQNSILLALQDRAQQLKVSEDRLAATGDKGYCLIRATHSVNRGRWYFEVTIEEQPEGSHTRIGWGQAYGNLQAPLGYDKFGYCWRSRKGTRFHQSHGKSYSEGYGEGDTLGFLIELPEEKGVSYLPLTYKDNPLVKFKSHLYYEDKDNVQETVKNLRVLEGSKITFFKNGQSKGTAFEDIYAGSYYPSISLFRNVTVSANFGPNFKYPEVLNEFDARGMNERVEELISEQTLADMYFLTEHQGRLRLENYLC